MFLGDVAAGNSCFAVRARKSGKGEGLGILNIPNPRFIVADA
jgi:hypothetical protein